MRTVRERLVLQELLRALDEGRAEAWSEALLTEYGSLKAALKGSQRRTLRAVDGDQRAYVLLRAVRRCHLDLVFAPLAEPNVQITGAMIADFLQHLIGGGRTEFLYAVFLDETQRLLDVELVARGDKDSCGLDPSVIVQRGVDIGASGIIIAHNHPSGDSTPSEADYRYAKRLAAGCQLFRMTLIDNLIIGRDGFWSHQAHGLL